MAVKLIEPWQVDREWVLALRNDPEARAHGDSAPVDDGWWEAVRADLRIIVVNGERVGYVIVKDGEVSILITRNERGRGIGTAALQQLTGPLHAFVKVDNVASRRAFEKAGFVRAGFVVDGLCYRRSA